MDHMSTPNLTHFVASRPHGMDVAKVFEGCFSALILRSIQFHGAPRSQPSTHISFRYSPNMLTGGTEELVSALRCEALELKKSPSSQTGPKHREVQNQFPNLKELTISNADVLGSLREKKEAAEAIMSHLRRWHPAQGIEPIIYGSGDVSTSTPEFQDDFCDKEARLLLELVRWEDGRKRYRVTVPGTRCMYIRCR